MNKYVFLFCFSTTFTALASPDKNEQQVSLLIKYQQDIFIELIRNHGHKIPPEVLNHSN